MRVFITVIGIIMFSASVAVGRVTDDLRLGAYPSSMGGAYVASASGQNSLYWNPAGLARFEGVEVFDLFIPQPYGISDITSNYMTVAYGDHRRRFGAGLAMRYLGADLEFGSNNGALIETVDYDEFEWITGGGVRILRNWYAGLNYKHYSISSGLRGADLSVSGSGMDIGTIYHWERYDINFGAAVRNFTAAVGSENVDPTFRVGMAKSFVDDHLRLAVDLSEEPDALDDDADLRVHVGGEFLPVREFGVRVGYDDGDLTGGFGVYLKGLSFEYAYVDNDVLDGTHQVSLGYRFGLPQYEPGDPEPVITPPPARNKVEPEPPPAVETRTEPKAERTWGWFGSKSKSDVKKEPAADKRTDAGKDYYLVFIDRFTGKDVPADLLWLEMAIKDIMASTFAKQHFQRIGVVKTAAEADLLITGDFTKPNGTIAIEARVAEGSNHAADYRIDIDPNRIFIGCENLCRQIADGLK